MHAIEVADLCLRYRRGPAVEGLSFTVEPGESVAVFGGSGSGKSTLLRLLAGGLKPEVGFVRVLGRAPRSVRRRIGYVGDGRWVKSLFSPHQVLSQSMVRHLVPGAQRPARMAEMLELLGLYADRDRPTRELSHGLQHAVAIAAELVHRPAVLLLDNVYAGLPTPDAERLRAYLEGRSRKFGLSVILATTRSEEAEQADRVLLMDEGHPLAIGSPAELLSRHATDVVTVEAADPEAVRKTLRGVFDVEITETGRGLRFATQDGVQTAAHLFRHPAGGPRVVYVRRPTLWDVIERLKEAQPGQATGRPI
jgi:ABC-2 type transport system ATP-binding protein